MSSSVDPQDTRVQSDPGMSLKCQQALRTKLGLNLPEISSFFADSEFVSLGSWCGVSLTLEKMGLRKNAYPFDYVRAPLDGVIKCLETGFEDFLSFTTTHVLDGRKCYHGTSWGGSFYHHDIESESTKSMFSRRIERFVGAAHHSKPSSRVFIRAANTPQDVDDSVNLLAALDKHFPNQPVFLLMIIDMQKHARLLRLRNDKEDLWRLLFYHVKEDLWTQCSNDMLTQRHRCADAYAPGIAASLAFWALRLKSVMQPTVVPNTRVLRMMTEHFYAGSPSNTLYQPNLLKQPSYVRVPDAWKGGLFTYTSNRHQKSYTLTVPAGCKAGEYLEVRFANGLVASIKAADADTVARL